MAGLRSQLAANENIAVSTKPVKVWLDVSWTGSLTSAWAVQSKITVATTLADYVQNGVQHYVFALASIDTSGNITDLRPKGSLSEQQGNSDYLRKDKNLSDVGDKEKARQVLELKSAALRDVGTRPGNVMEIGAGRFLAGTFISAEEDAKSIGARAATGCQFMRAYKAPDAPDQTSYWQIISLSEVVNPASAVDVIAICDGRVLFGHGTGAGITAWRHTAMLEGAQFTGNVSAENLHSRDSVTVADGTSGMTKGDVDGAGFIGNNLNIKSWNGIGFQNANDGAIRAYVSTQLGIIGAAEQLVAGDARFTKNGDSYGDVWGMGTGPGWLSAFIGTKPGRQNITQIGVYQNDKTKPFMLHDDGSGVFLATTDMLSGYIQSIRFGAVEHGMVWRAPGFADQVGYVITGVENGDLNDTPDRIQRRLLQLRVNGQWYTVGA